MPCWPNWQRRPAQNGKVEGSNPSHGTILVFGVWLTPNSRGDSLRNCEPWRCKSSHADHFLRCLASAGIADPNDLKSLSLPGASPGASNGVWLTGNSRPDRLKSGKPWECNSPHADHFYSWRVNQTSVLALFAKQRVPLTGDVVQVHGLPPFFEGRSLK